MTQLFKSKWLNFLSQNDSTVKMTQLFRSKWLNFFFQCIDGKSVVTYSHAITLGCSDTYSRHSKCKISRQFLSFIIHGWTLWSLCDDRHLLVHANFMAMSWGGVIYIYIYIYIYICVCVCVCMAASKALAT